MAVSLESLTLIEPQDVLVSLCQFIRRIRQREGLTQGELARKSGVPATTISRLERTGLISTDSLFRILFALDQLDSVQQFLKERLRLARVPKTLTGTDLAASVGTVPVREVKRVRHRREIA